MKKWIFYILLLFTAQRAGALNISYRVYDYSIHHSNGRIYLGGKFIQYKGAARNNLACIDLNNNLLPWAPSVFHNTNSNLSRVNTVVADTGAVFIGGPFTHVNGNPRARLAKLD